VTHFCRNIGKEITQVKALADIGGKKLVTERDGKLKNLLKRTYLGRWIGPLDVIGHEAEVHRNNEGKFFSRRSNSMDFARLLNFFFFFFFVRLSLNCLMHDFRCVFLMHAK
jgi:hypothetical protein